MPIGIAISTLFRTIVHDKINLILKTRVYQSLVLSRDGVGLYPRISARTTQNVGEISRPTGVGKRVQRCLRRLKRLLCRVPNLRNTSPTSIIPYMCKPAQSEVMGNDSRQQVETKSKAPYLFYRGHVEVKELKPASQYFSGRDRNHCMLTRTWYIRSAPTGHITMIARQKAVALPAPSPRACLKSI
jgi:hypothetical protein